MNLALTNCNQYNAVLVSAPGFGAKPFNSNSRPRVSFQGDDHRLLGLPELPDQPEEAPRNTPIESLQPNGGGFNLDYEEEDEVEGGLQLLPPREASQSVAKFRKDPEQPAASLEGK